MTLIKSSKHTKFAQYVHGTWGSFNTFAGQVNYLETKARLDQGTSSETRLTKFLKPVREALPIKDMDFNQLLQRDLDDHRVAVDLVPYLLTKLKGPVFFPPIVACLLPFESGNPLDSFPNKTPETIVNDEIGNSWSSQEYGESFKFDRLVDDETCFTEVKVGKLSWNEEKVELIIIDGQHRAMAILAIFRTIHQQWSGSAEKYKSFYENQVNNCLRDFTEEQKKSLFENLELPVNIIWFPNLESNESQQSCARKIFVDLNKNARPPSGSRLLLLTDTELKGIFTRRLLNEFRKTNDEFPIYAVEYDNPDGDQTSFSKWSVITNITNISESIKRSIFSADRYYKDQFSKFSKDSETLEKQNFRESLNIDSFIQKNTDEDGIRYEREQIFNTKFPPSAKEKLEEAFINGWGCVLLKMFSTLKPFKAHSQALNTIKDGMITGNSSISLAKEALFEGVGIYWTLRDQDDYFKNINLKRKEMDEKPMPRTGDVLAAWDIQKNKEIEFDKLRAKIYLNKDNEEFILKSNNCFSMFATAACQVGFILAVRSIAHISNVDFKNIPDFADKVITSANKYLDDNPEVLSKMATKKFNLLQRLDTACAVYFRYMWIEIILKNIILTEIQIDEDKLKELVYKGRKFYHDYLYDEHFKMSKRLNPGKDEASLRKDSTKQVRSDLKQAYRYWFKMSTEEFTELLTQFDSDVSAIKNSAIENLADGVEIKSENIDEVSLENESELQEDELMKELLKK